MKKGGFRFKSQLVYIAISNILFVASVGSAKAIEKQFVTSVVDQHVELAAPIEFHIKNSSNAVQNSTITINNEDAWVFFDNVRPQDVITNYASSIHIGAGVLNPGTNGRVAIYAHGTVVMPYGAGFKPLTVYKEDNFTGDSTSMAVQTYYNSLGNFDNAIHSFKLKRGYMATFANNSDGTGYSRVYIADNEDLNISELPPELDGKISFIRVFNYQWVTKKGWCQTGSSAKTSADKTNSTWYYSWSADQTSTSNLEYSVIKQNWSWPGWNEINNKQDISHLLGYNEPDHTEQSNIAVDDAVAQWPEFLKSGLRVGAPATTNFGWLYDFIDQCDARNYRVDYVAIHAYWGGKSPQSWYNDLKYIHERTGRPIWITEWNNGANWTNESWPDSNHALTDANATKQLNDLKGILQVLDTTSFIERYSIYNWVQDCRAIILNGNLTPAGEYYANDTSTIAFTHKNEVIPHWNNAANPKLSLEFLAATRQIKLTWNDPNGELASRVIVERKVNHSDFKEIYSSTDPTIQTLTDAVDDTLNGTLVYQVTSVVTIDDMEQPARSNTVYYHQADGQNGIQIADFVINDLDWQSCHFTMDYIEDPMVILGPATTNNTGPLTNRIKNITASNLNFKVESWGYITDATLNSPEYTSMLALPAGRYDFGGLTAEAGNVTGVTGDWKQVDFTQSYSEVPGVFCTQVTSNTTFPTTVHIRNVTTSGFEVRLEKEEAETGHLWGDKISYLAITPGEGIIDGKRIIVGISDPDAIGGAFGNKKIVIDPSFVHPAVFANLQTANDDITATMRYYFLTPTSLIFSKQREKSASSATMAKDQFAYLVADVQSNTSTAVSRLRQNKLKIYPNPVDNQLFFATDKPVLVELFDVAGTKKIEKIVTHSLDVKDLQRGVYLLKVEGVFQTKIIKQ